MTHGVVLVQPSISRESLVSLSHIVTDTWTYYLDSTMKDGSIHQVLVPRRYSSEPAESFFSRYPCSGKSLTESSYHPQEPSHIRRLPRRRSREQLGPQLDAAISQWSRLTARMSCWIMEDLSDWFKEL